MYRFFFYFILFFASATPAFCADVPGWWEPVLADTKLPVGRMYETMSNACEIITEKSLTPVKANDLAFVSIQSLSTIDQKISAVKDGKRVLILADGKILKSFSMPDDDDCANWTRMTLAAMIEARPYSPKAQKADAEEFFNIFLNAALETLDPYSHYEVKDQAELEPLRNPASIGIRYRRVGKYLEITEILPDSTAAASDLAVGDRIFAINSKQVADLSRVQTLNLLRGEVNSDVYLTLRKNGKIEQKTLKRKWVSDSPVSYFFDDKDKLMTIKINSFTPKTVKALKLTLDQAAWNKAIGLIIDLRGNMGGRLKEAVLAADMFLPEGFPMIRIEGRHHSTKQEYTSTEKAERPVYPIAILTDAKTASSAEFFAGVLQEYRHAVVIGTTTYGKSVIQNVENLPGGGELYLSWAEFFLPSGYNLKGYGIYPNICTSGKTLSDIDKLPPVNTKLKHWRFGEKSFRDKALKDCPPQVRKDVALDDEVARTLILAPEQYNRSLTYFSLDTSKK